MYNMGVVNMKGLLPICLIVFVLNLCSSHPYGDKRIGSPSPRIGWMDIFPRYIPQSGKKRACIYKGSMYEEGSNVATEEPCLKCKCVRGSLVCYLRVCPMLPDPPPSSCVLVLRNGACCSELVCEDGSISTNHISRSEPSADFPLNNATSYKDGCIANGTLYASGSAMWTDRPCEYCYCINGKERCVRPRCLPSPDGCSPRRASHSCCPVKYECTKENFSTSTTTSTMFPINNREKGCEVDGIFYPEGEKVLSVAKSPCDNCFCMKGLVRCVPLSCAPPLLGCTPNILPGECCASSYNCSRHITDSFIQNELNSVLEKKPKTVGEGTIISERSFPGDTKLTPSQITEILLNGDERNYRRFDNSKSNISNSENSTELNETTTTEIITTTETESITTEFTTTIDSEEILTTSQKYIHISENKTSNISIKNTTRLNQNSSIGTNNITENKSTINHNHSKLKDIIMDKSKTLINDTVNCTTDINLFNMNSTNNITLTELNKTENYEDAQERSPLPTASDIEDSLITIDSIKSNETKKNSTKELSLSSKFPSTSLIIPKDNDVFMVNVSTYVNTNNSVVTLRPVAAIPPEIEALLNISMKKNSQKDDYYDYDYKSLLPPSLPNLEIIPFLAIDAVPKSDEINLENDKEIDHYATSYPILEDEKPYLGGFSTIPREKYNATAYSYITSDLYNPTTYSSYTDEKYLLNPVNLSPPRLNNYNRNPIIYKQHINDKFKATTYNTIINDKYDGVQYAREKYDATVYPSLTIQDSQTENPVFAFENANHNLFSPPVETEGGFLPRDPALLDNYYNVGYVTSGNVVNSVTEASLLITSPAETNSDNCISNGRQYRNGELITDPNECVVCFCYYGDVHCQDPECPPIKPNCRRVIEKGKNCCGVEICDGNQEKSTSPVTTYADDFNLKVHKDITDPIKASTLNPFKNVMHTETAPNLHSLVSEILPYYSTDTSTTKKATSPSVITAQPFSTTTKTSTSTKVPVTVITISNETMISSSLFPINSYENKDTTTTASYINNIAKITTEYSPPIEEIEEEEEEFSFDTVLKLLLGDSSDITTKRTTQYTTKRFSPLAPRSTVQTSTTTMSPPSQKTSPLTTLQYLPTTQSTTISPEPQTTFKTIHKYSYSKPNRTSIPNISFQKNYTKPTILKSTTRQPIVYSTTNRPIKLKTSTSTETQPTVQYTKKNIFTAAALSTERSKLSISKLSVSKDPLLPFGVGLLKLAGCNIYGRMYRVGRIISELSGPCQECMCTEIGVQCKNLPC